MKLIAFMVLINIIAIIHELGHYFAARFTGTTVKKFSIGLGRKLFSWNRNGTEFCLSLIPIGGYIKMAGDDDTVPAKPTDPEGYFVRKTLLQRTSIIAAGPLFNFLLGFCLIIALFTFFGEPYVETVTITLDQGSVGNSESAAAPVKDMSPSELQSRMNAGERLLVVDTRPEPDRSAQPLEFARGLDAELMAELKEADRMMPLVFVCAHGISSRAVAEHYRKQGFTQVYNLEGGATAILGTA